MSTPTITDASPIPFEFPAWEVQLQLKNVHGDLVGGTLDMIIYDNSGTTGIPLPAPTSDGSATGGLGSAFLEALKTFFTNLDWATACPTYSADWSGAPYSVDTLTITQIDYARTDITPS